MSKNNHQGICSRCGSVLVVSEEFTRKSDGSLFPTTVTKFRCTDTQCQKDSDDKQAEMLMIRLEREEKSRNNRNKTAKVD